MNRFEKKYDKLLNDGYNQIIENIDDNISNGSVYLGDLMKKIDEVFEKIKELAPSIESEIIKNGAYCKLNLEDFADHKFRVGANDAKQVIGTHIGYIATAI